MRVFLLFLLLTASGLSASERYPYVASITEAETEVRSGPGMTFYPTSVLRSGEQVEVYYETENWCAIRPPVGSFSWIGARYVRLATNNIGTVIADGLASRVGSDSGTFDGERCDTVQVALDQGEKVFVLDRLETPENAASPLWYKIMPPSGEYRWIPRSAIGVRSLNPPSNPPSAEQVERAVKPSPRESGTSRPRSEFGLKTTRTTSPASLGADAGRSAQPLPTSRHGMTERGKPDDDILQVVYDKGETSAPAGSAVPTVTPPGRVVRLPRNDEAEENGTPDPRGIAKGAEIVSMKDLEEALQSSAKPASEPSSGAAALSSTPQLPPLADKLASSRPDSVSRQPAAATVDPFQAAFEELKEETRIVLTRPTEDWIFETLIHRGNELFEIAPTERDLEKVYHLVETLQRTRDVRQEIAYRRQFRTGALLAPATSMTSQKASPLAAYTTQAGATVPSGSSGLPSQKTTTRIPSNTGFSPIVHASGQGAGTAGAAGAAVMPETPVPKTGFDVVGKLGEFEPLPLGHPPYAVVDEDEQIVCLVSPASGVDLKPYIGQVIGINGILGIYEKKGKPNARHITAQTVGVVE